MLGLRKHDGRPSAGEVISHLVGWVLICELIGPYFLHHGTGDQIDVLAYAIGALGATFWWRRGEGTGPALTVS